MQSQTTPQKSILPDESCPGLRAWKTCKYVPFGEDQTDSKIDRVCIGHYDSCPRYLGHLALSSPSCKQARLASDESRAGILGLDAVGDIEIL